MSPNTRLLIILGGLNLLWGPVNLAVATSQQSLSTGAVAFFRWATFAALIWAGLALPQIRKGLKVRLPKGKHALQAVLIGLFFAGPAHAMYYVALRGATTSETTVLNTTGPLWVAALASLILREHVSARRWGAILIGVVGSYIVAVGFASPNLAEGDTLSKLLYLGGTLTESLAMILAIRVIQASSGPGTLAFQIIGSALSFLILSFALPGELAIRVVGPVDVWTIASMTYLVLVAGLVCFGLWYRFAEEAPISLMVISLGLQAPMGVLLGAGVRGEAITTSLIVGTALILLALVVAAREANQAPEPDAMQA